MLGCGLGFVDCWGVGWVLWIVDQIKIENYNICKLYLH